MRHLVIALILLLVQPAIAADSPSRYSDALSQFFQQAREKPSPYSDEDMAVMKRAGDELAQKLPGPGVRVGEKGPDFSLPNAFGNTVTLSEELGKGPVVLVFYRGAWCPFCNIHLHVLQQRLPEITAYGARLITVTPQKPDKSAEQIKKDGYPFEVLSDLDSKVMKDYRLYYELPDYLLAVYKKHGLDIEAFNGEGRTVLPVPGSFVIDTNGIVRAMFANTDYKQRMEPDDIIRALQEIADDE